MCLKEELFQAFKNIYYFPLDINVLRGHSKDDVKLPKLHHLSNPISAILLIFYFCKFFALKRIVNELIMNKFIFNKIINLISTGGFFFQQIVKLFFMITGEL